MTDVTITVEDGLRLSELNGQRSQLQYDLAHVGMTTIGHKIIICIVISAMMVLVIAAITSAVESWNYAKDPKTWKYKSGVTHRQAIMVAVFVIVLDIAVCYLLTDYIQQLEAIKIESQMTNIQSQIDAIYAKYGGGAS